MAANDDDDYSKLSTKECRQNEKNEFRKGLSSSQLMAEGYAKRFKLHKEANQNIFVEYIRVLELVYTTLLTGYVDEKVRRQQCNTIFQKAQKFYLNYKYHLNPNVNEAIVFLLKFLLSPNIYGYKTFYSDKQRALLLQYINSFTPST